MRITIRHPSEENPVDLRIKGAKYIGDFAIRLEFSDGHKPLVDFKPFLEESTHPAIKNFLNEELFKNFKIANGNLDWNDFDLCFPIEDFYKNQLLKKESPFNRV